MDRGILTACQSKNKKNRRGCRGDPSHPWSAGVSAAVRCTHARQGSRLDPAAEPCTHFVRISSWISRFRVPHIARAGRDTISSGRALATLSTTYVQRHRRRRHAAAPEEPPFSALAAAPASLLFAPLPASAPSVCAQADHCTHRATESQPLWRRTHVEQSDANKSGSPGRGAGRSSWNARP